MEIEKILLGIGFIFILIGGAFITILNSQTLGIVLAVIGVGIAGFGKIIGGN